MTERYIDYIQLIEVLLFYRDIGIFGAVTHGIDELYVDDISELIQLGIERTAPIFKHYEVPVDWDEDVLSGAEMDELDVNTDYHFHDVYSFSSPDMKEYYRLCRLYEHREGIEPEQNPYVRAADEYYTAALRMTEGQFIAGFDSEKRRPAAFFACFAPLLIVAELQDGTSNQQARSALKSGLVRRRGPLVFLPELPPAKEEPR